MEESIRTPFFCFLVFYCLQSLVFPALAESRTGQPEYSYDEATKRGPSKWGQLSPNWKTCEVSRQQTPISIYYNKVKYLPTLGPLQTHYKPATAAVIRSHHGVKVFWKADAGYLRLNGTIYNLIQFHWHWGSEHALNGSRHSLELHLVHSSPKGLAVIGILYKIGLRDPLLERLLPKLGKLGEQEEEIGLLDPSLIHFDRSEYFRYMGSLTTPPCSEGVVWTVIKKTKHVSLDQVAALKEIVKDKYGSTARPLQHLFGRTVYVYGL